MRPAADGLAFSISEAGEKLMSPAFLIHLPYLNVTFVRRDAPRRRLRSALREAAREFGTGSRNIDSEPIGHPGMLQQSADVQQAVRVSLNGLANRGSIRG